MCQFNAAIIGLGQVFYFHLPNPFRGCCVVGDHSYDVVCWLVSELASQSILESTHVGTAVDNGIMGYFVESKHFG